MAHWTEETYVENPDVIGANLQQNMECASDHARDLLELLSEHDIEPECALDVACGIGRHAIPLAESGLPVRGVDISRDYIERAREHAREAGVADRTTFEIDDMRDLGAVDGAFDLVLSWLSFGHFEDEANESVLRSLRDHVTDDGALVLGLHNRDGIVSNFQASAASLENGFLKVSRSEYTPETGRLESLITMFREEKSGYDYVGEAVVDFRLYGPAELRRMLNQAGFSTVHCYGGPDGTSLDIESDRLVVIAEP